MANSIDLGFLENCEPWRLESRFFPSKIGGKPAWLDLKNIPGVKQLACTYCCKPCIFLCQVYAPYDEDDKAFHRTIYLFVCKNPGCYKKNCSGNIKVLRSQLERVNEFYPSEPPVEEENWRSDINVNKWSKTCAVCGIFSSSHCSQCKKVNYCCRSHQVWHWKNGHKRSCYSDQHSISEKYMFSEYELLIEEEDFTNDKRVTNPEEQLKRFDELVKSGKAGTLIEDSNIDDDLLKMANGVEDLTFSKFCEKIKNEPEQVLRYNRGGHPLVISSFNKPENIPKCEECGGDRQFEFQIMPQLLHYLNRNEDITESIDWGILAIYTCKDSCNPKSKYVQEYVYKQDVIDN